jgi:UDPglucose 6-dehydrogenase
MITVMGLGFVGLTTALGFCEKGFKVYGYDISAGRVQTISEGKVPFHEEGLDEALKRHLNNNFHIVKDLSEAMKDSEVVFICVGTPQKKDGSADLTYIYSAVDQVLQHREGKFVVLTIKSTIPPTTTKEKVKPYIESKGIAIGTDLGLADNPEFLREGVAWQDFLYPDRIVIGAEDKRTADVMMSIYKGFNAPMHLVSYNTAEFIKYLSNTLLSTMISYSNEMSMAAYCIGDIDISKSFRILHEDKRWSGTPAKMTSYVYPGCGFGGYCLPKDTQAIYSLAKEKGCELRIIKDVTYTNQSIRAFVVDHILKNTNEGDTIGVLGLSFKSNSDDVRDTPASHIIKGLIKGNKRRVIAYDPLANSQFRSAYKLKIDYAPSMEELVGKTDNIVIVTSWSEFKQKRHLFEGKKLFDFRYYIEG